MKITEEVGNFAAIGNNDTASSCKTLGKTANYREQRNEQASLGKTNPATLRFI